MNAFTFVSPLQGVTPPPRLRVRCDASGTIGAKLYPGSLQLCAFFAAQPLAAGSVVIELGAGACGLPSLCLGAAGAQCVATDVPAMLPLLEANVERNRATVGGAGGSVTPAALAWGEPGHADGVRSLVRARFGRDADVIVAADVVYHEPLIAPLLAALLALTEPPALGGSSASCGGASARWAPPPIYISYVQRFKRARRFFKLAAQHFECIVVAGGVGKGGGAGAAAAATAVGGGRVVDYEALSWVLPRALDLVRRGADAGVPVCAAAAARRDALCGTVVGGLWGGGNCAVGPGAAAAETADAGIADAAAFDAAGFPVLHAGDAVFETHCELLIAAGAAAAAGGVPGSTAGASAAPPPPPSRSHCIDSDSGDEWEDPARAAQGFAAGLGRVFEEDGDAGCSLPAREAAARRAAAAAGLNWCASCESTVYVLRRRTASKGGNLNLTI